MLVATTVAALRDALSERRGVDHSIGLVPTMGALHSGHLTLISRARAENDTLAVSIFVNPLQFNENADFEHYPRDLPADLELAAGAGVDVVFAPATAELYPDGVPTVHVDPGVMGNGLEGASRPGHFAGVATVVAKLFALVAPDRAYFGEKDFEQLALVRRLVRDLSFPVEVISVETLRAEDGLALSSRNARLSRDERVVAPVLNRAHTQGAEALRNGATIEDAEARMREVASSETQVRLDYAVVLDAESMQRPDSSVTELRLLIAARLGQVRLIDNLPATRPSN